VNILFDWSAWIIGFAGLALGIYGERSAYTERKAAQAAEKEAEQKFQKLYDLLADQYGADDAPSTSVDPAPGMEGPTDAQTDEAEAAELVVTAPTTTVAPAVDDGPELSAEQTRKLRSELIRCGVNGSPYRNALDWARRQGIPAAGVDHTARLLRERGLLTFDEPLGATSVLQLSEAPQRAKEVM
jgi:hypothetical protein